MPRERFYQKLGLDLVQATKNELDFLQQVDECPSLYKSSALKNAIRRYEVFWLPLAAREGYGSRFLAAPLDIAWVWHVHMLSPYNYEQDCLNCVSKIVDHVPLGDLERKRGLEKARYLWEREYSDEPFDVDLSQSQIVQMDCSNSKIQYDLERACYRQFKFYYQVSLPHYRDAKFLEKAVERYDTMSCSTNKIQGYLSFHVTISILFGTCTSFIRLTTIKQPSVSLDRCYTMMILQRAAVQDLCCVTQRKRQDHCGKLQVCNLPCLGPCTEEILRTLFLQDQGGRTFHLLAVNM